MKNMEANKGSFATFVLRGFICKKHGQRWHNEDINGDDVHLENNEDFGNYRNLGKGLGHAKGAKPLDGNKSMPRMCICNNNKKKDGT